MFYSAAQLYMENLQNIMLDFNQIYSLKNQHKFQLFNSSLCAQKMRAVDTCAECNVAKKRFDDSSCLLLQWRSTPFPSRTSQNRSYFSVPPYSLCHSSSFPSRPLPPVYNVWFYGHDLRVCSRQEPNTPLSLHPHLFFVHSQMRRENWRCQHISKTP